MVLKTEIENAVRLQKTHLGISKQMVVRDKFLKARMKDSHVLVVSGVRRSGKSVFLKMLMKHVPQPIAFLNFEDPRIYDFNLSDFIKLDEVLGVKVKTYFFDEIQNVENWEIYVRQLHDQGKKVCITGSNASLLSKELGTRLTGRYTNLVLFPFSYSEFLTYKKRKNTPKNFESYLNLGGFPEYLRSENVEYLQNLLKDIVLRDIAIRYGVKNTKTLMDLTLYLISNIGKECTYNSLKKTFSIGSANSVSDYLNWLEDTYLLFFVEKFSWSAKNRSVNPRKVYAIDNGLANANSLSYTEDKGRLLENAVLLFLKQQSLECFYFRENKECDFVVMHQKKCLYVIQVCYEVNLDNQQRELDGLFEAMTFFKMKEGLILTLNQSDEFIVEGKKIKLVPVNVWMKSVIK